MMMMRPHPLGVFSTVTAFRPIAPNATFVLKLDFIPQTCQKYFEVFTVKTSLRTVRVAGAYTRSLFSST
jgi:hypothetical protein